MTSEDLRPDAISEPIPSVPERNSISDLDITTEQRSATQARSLSPVTDAVRDRSGAAGLGFFVALVDVNTAMPALCTAHPDWIATADLMLHEAAPLVRGPAILESNLARAGSRLIVIGVDIYEGDGLTDLDDVGRSDHAASRGDRTGHVRRAYRLRPRPRQGCSTRSAASGNDAAWSPSERCRPSRCSSGAG